QLSGRELASPFTDCRAPGSLTLRLGVATSACSQLAGRLSLWAGARALPQLPARREATAVYLPTQTGGRAAVGSTVCRRAHPTTTLPLGAESRAREADARAPAGALGLPLPVPRTAAVTRPWAGR